MTRSTGAILRRISRLEKRVGNSVVSSIPSRRKSFGRLQQCSLFQDAPDPFSHVSSLALRQVSDEHLQLLIGLARDQEAGLCRTVTEGESAALAAYEAAAAAMGAVSRQSLRSSGIVSGSV
jgi:hypothetical protein